MDKDGQEVVHTEIQQESPTNLYCVDMATLHDVESSPIISQGGDYTGPAPKLFGGHAGFCPPCRNPNPEEDIPFAIRKLDIVCYGTEPNVCSVNTIPSPERKRKGVEIIPLTQHHFSMSVIQ